MSLSALQQEFAQAAARLISYAPTLGYAVTLGEGWRSPEQCAWNAEKGTGILNSLHGDRLAIDLNFFKNGQYISDGSQLADIGAWWESQLSPIPGAHYRWGGRIVSRPDGNHFSLSPDNRI